jgi:predicted lipid-binding transport protein (Tim44 family)
MAALTFLIFYRLFREFGKFQKIVSGTISGKQEKFVSIENILQKPIQKTEKTITALQNNILAIRQKFPDFTPTLFLQKAEEMFDIIFNSFAQSNYLALKPLLTDSLYQSFADKIQKREKQNLRQELSIKHKSTTLDKIQIFTNKAKLFVTFDISQMSAIINSEEVSFDNPKRLYRDVIHKWIFERQFDAKDWILSKTSSFER